MVFINLHLKDERENEALQKVKRFVGFIFSTDKLKHMLIYKILLKTYV